MKTHFFIFFSEWLIQLPVAGSSRILGSIKCHTGVKQALVIIQWHLP